MPHQCVKCNTIYEDGDEAVLKGCSCGGKLFFYIKKNQLKKDNQVINLSEKEKEQIQKDVSEMVGLSEDEKPVVLDIESINVSSPGKYLLDVVKLFKKDPLVFKLEEGKYVIDIGRLFEQSLNKEDINKRGER